MCGVADRLCISEYIESSIVESNSNCPSCDMLLTVDLSNTENSEDRHTPMASGVCVVGKAKVRMTVVTRTSMKIDLRSFRHS